MSKVEIDFADLGRTKGAIKIDGKEVQGVTDVSVHMSVGGIPSVDIEVLVTGGHLHIDSADTTITPKIATVERRA